MLSHLMHYTKILRRLAAEGSKQGHCDDFSQIFAYCKILVRNIIGFPFQ